MKFKQIIKALLEKTPYRIRRAQGINRFEAFSEGLSLFAKFGFNPTHIIDGGANVGSFSVLAHRIFPNAKISLVEPQPACASSLRKLCETHGFDFQQVALTDAEASGQSIPFLVDKHGITTGARVKQPTGEAPLHSDDVALIDVAACSLDQLFPAKDAEEERVFIKLDLEGHELAALKGASELLKRTEAVLLECAFFNDGELANTPLNLANFLSEHGFLLFDVLAISGRPSDGRARQCDLVFVKNKTVLDGERRWT